MRSRKIVATTRLVPAATSGGRPDVSISAAIGTSPMARLTKVAKRIDDRQSAVASEPIAMIIA